MFKKDRVTRFYLILGDLVVYNIAFLFAYFCLFVSTQNIEAYLPDEQFLSRLTAQFILSIILCLFFLLRFRHYSFRKPFWMELKEILHILLIFSLVDLSIVAFSKWDFSRTLWVISWFFIFILMPLTRFSIKTLLIKLSLWAKNTVIIGSDKNVVDIIDALNSERFLGADIKAFYQVEPIESGINLATKGINVYPFQTLFSSDFDVHSQFILTFGSEHQKEQEAVLNFLINKGHRNIQVVPNLKGIPLYSTDMSFLFSHEVILFRIHTNLVKATSRFIKRAFDLVSAITLVILLFPLFIWIYLCVRKDGGAVFFAHKRVGLNGQLFNCLKFRTMVTNSETVLQDLLAKDANLKAEWEKDFKLKDDPRITKIGAFLRRSSLDELPQLFNVIMGQMSIVGPRPIVKDELSRYEENISYYLMAKPGITGLWQVSGRNDVDYEKRVYFDVWYVKNWSLWNDCVILFKTIGVVFSKSGAY